MKINLFPNPLKNADIFGLLKPGGQFTNEFTDKLNSKGLGGFTHFHNDIAPWIAAAVASYGALSGGAAGGLGGLGGAGGGAVQLSGPGYAGAGAAAGAGEGVSGGAGASGFMKYARLASMAQSMGGQQGGGTGFGGPPQHQFVGAANAPTPMVDSPYLQMLRRRLYG